MERKMTYVFHWAPKFDRIVNKRHKRHVISPCFSTIYKDAALRWRLIFYPNGDVVEHTKNFCAIYVQLVEYPYLARFQVNADVEIDLFANTEEPHWHGAFSATFVSSNLKYLHMEGKNNLGPNIKSAHSLLHSITDERILFRCSLTIPIAQFFALDNATTIRSERKSKKKHYRNNDLSMDSDIIKSINQYFGDVTLVSSDDQEFLCSSLMLGERSEVLKNMFVTNGFKETNERRAELELNGETLKNLILYLYTGVLSADSLNTIDFLDLLYAADKYNVAGLKESCENMCPSKMLNTLNETNVWSYFRTAEKFNFVEVKKAVLEFIIMNSEICLQREDFSDIRLNQPSFYTTIMESVCERASYGFGAVARY